MRKILGKIFGAKQGTGRLFIAGLGFLIGLSLLLFSIQLYLQIQKILQPSKSRTQYLIISKKINLGNTLMLSRAEFGKSEIEDLKKQPFVAEVGTFISNQFEVLAFSKGKIPFMTEIFFESVPDQMLDKIPDNWSWNENAEFVPVILSQDMLNLYNFGFAIGKGLPQLSPSTVNMVSANLKISGPKGERAMNAKIVGFSERISSILVPQSFMIWANNQIGPGRDDAPGRLILKVPNPADPRLAAYFERKNYQINEERLSIGKAGALVQTVMSIIGLAGLLFIFLSVAVLMMNFRLILAEAKEEIRLLLQLGYTSGHLTRYLFGFFSIFIGITFLLSAMVVWYANSRVQDFFRKSGFETQESISLLVWVTGVGFVLLTLVSNFFSIQRILRGYQ